MKIFVCFVAAIVLSQGILSQAPSLGEDAGAPSSAQQKQAAVEILIGKCGVLFPNRVCFPEDIVDASTKRQGTSILISVAFKVCCYAPGSTSVSSSFLVKGILETTPGFNVVALTDVSAVKAAESCPKIKELDALKAGDDVAKAVLQRLDTLESRDKILRRRSSFLDSPFSPTSLKCPSPFDYGLEIIQIIDRGKNKKYLAKLISRWTQGFVSGLSGSFSGFEVNNKKFIGETSTDLGKGFSVALDVRAKSDAAGLDFEDFEVAASVLDGRVLCVDL